MRSHLDDLLAELDDSEHAPVTESVPHAEPPPRTRVDELLQHLNEDYSEPEPVHRAVHPPSAALHNTREKCYPPVISGTSLPVGLTLSSRELKSCDMLRCTKCDIPVKRFVNKAWKEDVDYLFFRNNYSREQELAGKLSASGGWCAYSCQCTWRSTREVIELSDGSWVCRGHLL